jgi:hypothetical protein
MNQPIGLLLTATAVAHTVVGVILYRRPLASIIGDGVLNAVDPHIDRRAAFWFLLFGPVLVMTGRLADSAVRRGDAATAGMVARNLLGVGIAGAAAMPLSGFWLLIGISALMLRTAARLERAARDALP